MHYVIGSGPSGVMCALALLDAGLPVTLLDVGRRLEPERSALVADLAGRPPESWDGAAVAAIRRQGPVGSSGFPKKLAFGSDYAYAGDDEAHLRQEGTRCSPSLARGGLSNVWGAAVLPWRREDTAGWPLSVEELAPHYDAVARAMPIAAAEDDLASILPLYGPLEPPARLSRQGERLLAHLEAHRSELTRRGVLFGRSRLAMRTGPADPRRCRYVGMCLTGCPYGSIYSAADTLERLRARPGFEYRPGVCVEAVSEPSPDGVEVRLFDARHGRRETLSGRRAFVAAGALSTLRILARPAGLIGRALPLRYHPYFLLPMLALRNTAGVDRERQTTLAQLFVELLGPDGRAIEAHLQLYGYNDLIGQRLEAMSGRLARVLRPPLLGRLLAVQGYLSSDRAEPIAVTPELEADGQVGLRLSAPAGDRLRAAVNRVAGRLLAASRPVGAVPLWPLLQLGRPGDGNHIGAVLPMSRRRSEVATDTLGRLAGLERTHIVDASVLPSLAPTTITYTAMANAHRIGAIVGAADRAAPGR